MATPRAILDAYSVLTGYCDAFWKRVAARFPDQFACHAGCGICCTLTSVNHLEAAVIAAHVADHPLPPGHDPAAEAVAPCPFLTADRCSVYAARPLICRTHGLPLRGTEFSERIMHSCPYNFAAMEIAEIDDSFALDIEKISLNLARLNQAWCLTHGLESSAAERVMLADLAKK
jgi:Fe-S-cluster containining protein